MSARRPFVTNCMLQEKLIAKQLEISDLIASSGWLEKFKKKYSICSKTVSRVNKISDVSKETMESWNKRTTEILLDML